jgi:thymidylate synthase
MKQYLDALQHIKMNGVLKTDRTGTGTTSVFGYQMRFDLSKGFPLVTTKKVAFRLIVLELLWFIKGMTNNNWLTDRNVHIWDEWAKVYRVERTVEARMVIVNKFLKKNNLELQLPNTSHDILDTVLADISKDYYDGRKLSELDRWERDPLDGELGPIYGKQWRSWPGKPRIEINADHGFPEIKTDAIDQLAEAINTIKTNPDSRRIMVSSWNVGELKDMALMPCHALFQFYVDQPKGATRARLSCQLYQRSADVFLGVPFNIASYALLTHMVAQQCDMEVGDFIWTGGDCHIYSNHAEQTELQLTRVPLPLCTLNIKRKPDSIEGYELEDFELFDYQHHAAIKGAVAI